MSFPPGAPPQQSAANIARLNDTLKRSAQPYEVGLVCTTLGLAQSTSLRVDFDNVSTPTDWPTGINMTPPPSLRVVWETRTNDAEAEGHIYLWNWITSAWDEQYVDDDGPYTMTGFKYVTPEDNSTWSTRREIIVCGGAATYVDAGKVRVRIDHSHTLTGWGDPRLSAWHDLVQVSLDDLSACGGTIGGGTQGRSSGSGSGGGGEGDPEARFAVQSGPKGADHNSDGEVSLDDIAEFMDDYNAGLLIADYSGDDRVNADDLQRFTALYTQGR